MDKNVRNFNQKKSPFYDLSGDDYNKPKQSGSINIFADALKRDNSAAKANVGYYVNTEEYIRKPKKRKSKRRRQSAGRGVTLSVLMMYAVVGFFMASWLIMRYSSIIKTDEELDALQNKITILQTEVEQKKLQVSLKDDIGMVQVQARERLNMDYPQNDQIVYITLNDTSKTQQASASDVINNETGAQ